MIYCSKQETFYWIPVISILTAFATIIIVVYLLLNEASGILLRPGVLALLLIFPSLAALKAVLEIKMFSRNGNELSVKGAFKKKLYSINDSVLAVTSTGREKTIGLCRPRHDNREILGGILTIASAVKYAKLLSKHLHIPYGETEMFKKLKSMGLHK